MSFQQGRGAPESITLNKLISWTEDGDKGVKYFSGAGTYRKTVEAPAQWSQKGHDVLALNWATSEILRG